MRAYARTLVAFLLLGLGCATSSMAQSARFINFSARGLVHAGDNVLIAGFVVDRVIAVVVRARGPSLAAAGVSGALDNPQLQVLSEGRELRRNDDWQTEYNGGCVAELAGFAPPDPRESAIWMLLPPGAYTAIVSGVGGATGVAILEVFATSGPPPWC